MPNHLTELGILHTIISIFALIAGFYTVIRYGKINPLKGTGQWYMVLTVITCITGFPIMKTGHPTVAHILGAVVLLMIVPAIYARQLSILGNKAKYVETILMSGTLFLSMIPAIVETLTRLPISKPIASGPDSPVIQLCQLVLLVFFVAGVIYQIRHVKADETEEVKA